MSEQSNCQVCGISKSNHNMLHPFQPKIRNRFVDPNELRGSLLPQQDYLLVNANPCQVCNKLPQNHSSDHSYQPKFSPGGSSFSCHSQYAPQKEYQGIVSESYYKGYELLVESKDQIPVEDNQRRYPQNLKEHFPGHPHDHKVGLPGSLTPRKDLDELPGYSLNPHHSNIF